MVGNKELRQKPVLFWLSLGLPWSVIHRDVFESSFQTNEILIDDMLAKSGLAGYCEIIKDNMEVKYSKGLWLAAFAVLGSEWPAFQKVFGADQHASDCKARKCQDCGWTPCYSAGILPTLRTVSFIWLQVQSELRRPWLGILLVHLQDARSTGWHQHSFPSLALSDWWFLQDLSMSPSGWSRVCNPSSSGYRVLGLQAAVMAQLLFFA